MVGEPERHSGDVRGAGLNLDAVKLVHVALDVFKLLGIERVRHIAVAPVYGLQGFDRVQLQAANFAVGDHQKIAAPTRRVQQVQATHPHQLGLQLRFVATLRAGLVQPGLEFIQKQRTDHAQDVGLAGVVRAEFAPFAAGGGDALVVVVDNRLEQRAEDGRADRRPVEGFGAVQQYPAGAGGKVAARQLAVKHAAVDVGKGLQLLRQRGRPVVGRAVKHIKQVLQRAVQVRAVDPRVLTDVAGKITPPLKDTGVLGKQAKQHTNQIALQIDAGVAAGAHGVMEFGDFAGGALVDGNLLFLRLRLEAREKQVAIDVFAEVGQLVLEGRRVGVQVIEVQVFKVADQKVGRQFFVR